MRKLFSAALAIVMVLTLVACGGEKKSESGNAPENDTQANYENITTVVTDAKEEEHPKEIEITIDNWQDYLELKYMVSWKYNAFDEIEGFSHLYPVLALKDEYADKTVSSNTELAVGFSATQIWKCVSADAESKTYEWGEENGYKGEVNETAKYQPQVSLGDPRILNEGGLIFLSYFGHHENGRDSYPYYEDFTITRIEGTLIFE